MLCLGFAHSGHARDADELIEYSLDQLLKMDVVIRVANKLDESLVDTAGAVYVIDSRDIRRSGVRTVPDALRLAPGVQVGQISSNEWAISIRGLNGRFSRHLLVLVDGRSVYNSLFGGVNWDEHDIPMQDIERIEVIRGPAGQVWGANAVNGVINIVTRKRAEHPTTSLAVGGGAGDRQSAYFRTGGEWGPGRYRLSLADDKRGGFTGQYRGVEEDSWRSERLSADYTWQEGSSENLTASLNYFRNEASPYLSKPALVPPYNTYLAPTEKKNGYALQLQYNHRLSDLSEWRTRVSFDSTDRQSSLRDWDSGNMDWDLEYTGRHGSHLLNTGINLRFSESTVVDYPESNFHYSPQSREVSLLGFYLQDTYEVNKAVNVTLGTKVEKHSEVGTSFQPTLRTLWKVADNHRLWMAASKAQNTPARSHYDYNASDLYTIPPGEWFPLPVLLVLQSRPDETKHTILRSFEAGYRYRFKDVLSIDVAVYDNEYHNLRDISTDFALVPHLFTAPRHLELPLYYDQSGASDIQGLEISIAGTVSDHWSLELSSSFLDQKNDGVLAEDLFGLRFITTVSPDSQHVLRSSHDLGARMQLDLIYRYVAEYEGTGIDSYSAVDLSFNWQFTEQLGANVRFENMGADKHTEFYRELHYVDTFELSRSVFFELEWATR